MTVLRNQRTYPLTLTSDPLNTGIVAAYDWASEDGSTAASNGKDHSGLGHHMTAAATNPTIVQGVVGKGRDTSVGRTTSNSSYSIASAAAMGMDVGTGDFSVYRRIQTPSVAPATTTLHNIARLSDGGGQKFVWGLYEVTSTGAWHLTFGTTSTTYLAWNTAGNPANAINKDVIIHVTRSAGTLKIFVNGTLLVTRASETTSLLSTVGSTCNAGNFGTSNIVDNLNVDDIYWNRALTDAEVAAHAANPYSYYVNSAAADAITVNVPVAGATVSAAGISISGTYTGGTVPTSIEASFNGGAFATITSSQSGGNFSGTLTGQAAGNGTLTVRSMNGTTVVATTTVTNVTVVSDSISFTGMAGGGATDDLTRAVAYRTFQRDASNQASVLITGSYTGTPTSIEYQWNGGAWATLIASPTGGTFRATITLTGPAQGPLSVRFSNSTGISASLTAVGVGDVFIVAGQSNHVGMSITFEAPVAPGAHPGWVSTECGKDGVWKQHLETSANPFDDRTNAVYSVENNGATVYGSYFGALATKIMAAGVPVAFVPCAVGSTGIDSWAVSTATTSLYGAALARANSVGDYKAMLWWQGENDTTGTLTQTQFADKLDALVNDWFTRTGKKWFVWAINATGNGSNFQAIHDAIIQVGQTNANCAGYADLNGAFSSSVHYGTVPEIDEIANRTYTALNSAYTYTTTPATSVTVTLTDSSGTARASLSGLKWAFFDQVTPDLFAAPVAKGAVETTDASGVLVISLTGTSLSAGAVGWLIVTDSDGTTTQSPAHKAFSGPVVTA